MDKVIQCVWLGGPKTKLAEKCRASWERFAPDWEIREWNEVPAEAPSYVRRALQERKWAFASDWMRFWILEREGGVYLDYDVELVAPIGCLPDGEWVAAEWLRDNEWGYNPGSGISLAAGSPLARQMLAWYRTAEFGTSQTVGDVMGGIFGKPEETKAIRVLKPQVMCPTDWQGKVHRTDETVAIHHYALSWITPRRRIARWMSWHGLDWAVRLLLRMRGRLLR